MDADEVKGEGEQMVKFRESRPEKKAEETRTEDKRGAEEEPVWYKAWWGVLIAIAIFFILLFFLIWGVWGKPKWIRINVANCNVAFLEVGITYLFLRVRSRVVKFISGLLWLLFLPNTVYLFTDLGHIIYQWNNTVSLSDRMLLLVQYLLLELFGIITFLFSFLPFEKIIDRINVFKKEKLHG